MAQQLGRFDPVGDVAHHVACGLERMDQQLCEHLVVVDDHHIGVDETGLTFGARPSVTHRCGHPPPQLQHSFCDAEQLDEGGAVQWKLGHTGADAHDEVLPGRLATASRRACPPVGGGPRSALRAVEAENEPLVAPPTNHVVVAEVLAQQRGDRPEHCVRRPLPTRRLIVELDLTASDTARPGDWRAGRAARAARR